MPFRRYYKRKRSGWRKYNRQGVNRKIRVPNPGARTTGRYLEQQGENVEHKYLSRASPILPLTQMHEYTMENWAVWTPHGSNRLGLFPFWWYRVTGHASQGLGYQWYNTGFLFSATAESHWEPKEYDLFKQAYNYCMVPYVSISFRFKWATAADCEAIGITPVQDPPSHYPRDVRCYLLNSNYEDVAWNTLKESGRKYAFMPGLEENSEIVNANTTVVNRRSHWTNWVHTRLKASDWNLTGYTIREGFETDATTGLTTVTNHISNSSYLYWQFRFYDGLTGNSLPTSGVYYPMVEIVYRPKILYYERKDWCDHDAILDG